MSERFIKENVTYDDLIATLVAIKTPKMPPPKHLELPKPFYKAMRAHSQQQGGTFTVEGEADTNGVSIKLSYSTRCDSFG